MLMKTDSLGIPRFTNRDLIDMIYSGNIDKCHIVLCDQNDDIDKFNTAMEEQGLLGLQKYISLDVDEKTFDNVCQSEWFMPEEYKEISVKEFLRVYNKNINLVQDQNQKDIDYYINLYSKYKLKLIEAKELGYDLKDSYKKEFTSYKNQLSNAYTTDKEVTES